MATTLICRILKANVIEYGSPADIDVDLTEENQGLLTGFGLKSDLDLGSVPASGEAGIEPPNLRGFVLQRGFGLPTMRLLLKPVAPDMPTLLARARILATALSEPRTWQWQEEGMDTYRFIDALGIGTLPALLHGQPEALRWIMRKLTDPGGIPIEVLRQPFLRGPRVINAFQGTVTNRAGSRKFQVSCNGNMGGLAIVRVQPDVASTSAVGWKAARRAKGNQSEWYTSFAAFEIDGATLDTAATNPTTIVADTAASGGNKAHTVFNQANAWYRSWRKILTPVDKLALAGKHLLAVTINPDLGQVVTLRLRFGFAIRPGDNPQSATPFPLGRDVVLDMNKQASKVWFEVPFDELYFDANMTQLVVEGWAMSDTATKSLDWDVCQLWPSDEMTVVVSVPNLKPPNNAVDSWPSAQNGVGLFASPAGTSGNAGLIEDGTSMFINREKQGLAPQPLGGRVFQSARHFVTVSGRVRNNDKVAIAVASLRARLGGTTSVWAPGTTYGTNGVIVEPTSANRKHGRTYRLVSHTGTGATGTEPAWPDSDGGQIVQGSGGNTSTWLETTVASADIKSVKGSQTLDSSWSLSFDSDGSTQHEILVVQLVTGKDDGYAVIRSFRPVVITHAIIAKVDNPSRLVVDSYAEKAYQDGGGGDDIQPLYPTGWFTLAYGPNDIAIAMYGVPVSGQDAVDGRGGPNAQLVPTDSFGVQVDVVEFFAPQ